jgi:hypothetical protein
MIQFNDFSNIAVIGCSSSGKSHIVAKILYYARELFPTKPTKIIYAYTMWQPLFNKLEEAVSDLIFVKGLPTEEYVKEVTYQHPHSIIVLDDMYEIAMSSPFVRDMLTKLSHHLKLSTILISQNSSYAGKYKSDITKNTHYTLLTNSPRNMHSVRSLGIQLGDCSNLIKAYKDSTSVTFGYLLVDSHPQTCRKYGYRTHIFPNQNCVVYTFK